MRENLDCSNYCLQCEDDAKKIAELERKLAEQQVAFLQHGKVNDTEELNTLLAKAKEEGRKEAVPEGWQIVPKHSRIVKIELWDGKFWQPEGSSNYNRMIEAMLAAAPKPQGEWDE